MTAPGLLREVAKHLEAAGIPFMLTGSVAAAFHGAGRATMDVDLVIDATSDQLRTFVNSISGPDIYVSSHAALEARDLESMFNVVEAKTGWKVDLIICKSRPFSQTEFARRRFIEFDGIELAVAALEDVIISKLEWAKLGGSARQIEDVSSLLRVAAGEVDQPYLDHWISELGLQTQWQRAGAAAMLPPLEA